MVLYHLKLGLQFDIYLSSQILFVLSNDLVDELIKCIFNIYSSLMQNFVMLSLSEWRIEQILYFIYLIL